MPVLDSVVSLLWIGGLVIVLLGRAIFSWLRFRYATRSAVHARRLAEATRPLPRPEATHKSAEVLAFRTRAPALPTTPKREA